MGTEEVKTLNKIVEGGISADEVKILQEALADPDKKTKLENNLNQELSTYLKTNTKETNFLIIGIKTALKTAKEENKKAYQTLLNAIKKIINPKENTEKSEAKTNILETERDETNAQEAMETNLEDFNKIFEAASNNQNLEKLKNLVINYSNKNKKAEDIQNIDAVTASAGDPNFVTGVKYLKITSTNGNNNEIFSFGDQNKLVERYTNYIKKSGKLTANNLDTKFKILEKDKCEDVSNADAYYTILAKKISTNKLESKFLNLFVTNGKVNKNMLKYLGKNKNEQLKNLNTIASNMTTEQKKQINKIKLQVTAPKFSEDLGSKDVMDLGLDAIKQKFGPVKGVLTKILNMINSNPMLKSMFGGFFDRDNGIEDRLTEEYELSDDQTSIINDMRKSLGTDKRPIQNMATIIEKKNKIIGKLTDEITFDDISPDFIKYMNKASTENKKYTASNKNVLISDYMEMIEDKNSPLRKNYEESMKQLKNDGIKNADLIQIMSASILNFQQDGEGMKYLWTRNNKKDAELKSKANTPETPAQKGKKTYENLITNLGGIDKMGDNDNKKAGKLLSIYDKILSGKDTNLMAYIKTLNETNLNKLFQKFPAYLKTIDDQGLTGAYNKLPQDIQDIQSINFENNTLKINNTEITMTEKPFPEDVKTAFDKIKNSNTQINDRKDAFKKLNTNYDDIALYLKKEQITGGNTYGNLLINQAKLLLPILNNNNDNTVSNAITSSMYTKKSINITDNNQIQIQLKNKDWIVKQTINITQTEGNNLPTFSIAS